MRSLAFSQPDARLRLEAILHPLIRAGTRRGIESAIQATAPYVLVAVPLLVESRDWRGRYQRILVVDCPPEIQLERVMRRSALERSQVEAIMAAQASREQRLAAADDVIDNSGDPNALAAQVDRLDLLSKMRHFVGLQNRSGLNTRARIDASVSVQALVADRVEEGEHLIVFALFDRIEFVIMTLSAAQR
jgi:dephospho-CoA kinase